MEQRDKDTVQFYYSRERRLAKAGPLANWAAERAGRKTGFFASLVATPALRLLFIMTVFALIAYGVVGLAGAPKSSGTLDGFEYSLAAMWYDGTVYLSLERSAPGGGSPGPVLAELVAGSGAEAAGPFALGEGETGLRRALPMEAKPARVKVAVKSAKGAVELTAPVN